MSNDDLKYLFEQMLDFIPKDDNYFKNMVKLTKVFKDLADIKELDEVEDIRESCECTLSKAVEKLSEELKNDKDLYFGYQANIAMAFQDTVTDEYPELQGTELHKVSNDAAKRFLTLFIKDVERK